MPPGLWPGQQRGYTTPPGALFSSLQRQPMFGEYQGPRYTGPFNFGRIAGSPELGMMAQLAAPHVAGAVMGENFAPFQFNPQQSAFDQLAATRDHNRQHQAMVLASRRDQTTLNELFGGVTQSFTGEPLTEVQRARNNRLSGGIAGMMPILTQVMGPDTVDQMFGRRGSSTVMAQQMQQVFRTAMDPVTGRMGFSGRSTAEVTGNVFENLFGPGANIAAMRGMSAGQAGILAGELSQRGVLGPMAGAMPLEERLNALPSRLRDDQLTRIAERIPFTEDRRSLADLRAANEDVTEDMVAKAKDRVRNTFQRMGPGTTVEEIEQLPGGEDILRTSDARQISDRLKNMAGAVSAMREIFGDMGRPDAPMREIVNGLEALTQGGLATMNPGEIESLVRRTQAVANQTGVGVPGQLALMAQNTQLADRLGLDRRFALRAAQQGAIFGKSLEDTRRLDIPAWGAVGREQLVMADQQLRMQAAASPMANQTAAVLRMRDRGVLGDVGEDTELSAFMQAVEDRQQTYEFRDENGDRQVRNVAMSRQRLQEMMKRDAGISFTQSQAAIFDRASNQEMVQKYGTDLLARERQTTEAARRMFAPNISGRISGTFAETGVDEVLSEGGVTRNRDDFRKMMDEVGRGVSADFFKLSGEEVRNPTAAQEALGRAFRDRLQESILRRKPDATPQEVGRLTRQTMERLGGDVAMDRMGSTIFDTINQVAGREDLFKSAIGAADALSQDAHRRAREREPQVAAEEITREALGGLATAEPMRRMVDAFREAGPDTPFREILARGLGGVNVRDLMERDPTGQVRSMMGLLEENRTLDPGDPQERAQMEQNARMIKGMVEGGDAAKRALAEAEQLPDGRVPRRLMDNLWKAAEGEETIAESMREAGAENIPERRRGDDAEAAGGEAGGKQTTEETLEMMKERARREPGGDAAAAAGQGGEELRVRITSGALRIDEQGRAHIDGAGTGTFETVQGAF